VERETVVVVPERAMQPADYQQQAYPPALQRAYGQPLEAV
jgi:hypothetical protein